MRTIVLLVAVFLFLGPIVLWAVWPVIALLAAVYAVHTIQRRRHMSALSHQS